MTETNSLLQWLGKLGITKQLNNSDILSGVTVNAALTKVIPNYTIRISLTNTASTRINNWNTVINQLQKINIHVGQQDKSKILNGDDKIVYNILYEIREYYNRNRQDVEVDINKIDARGDPKTAKSLLQLFILLIIKHYGFSVKQAVALLSNDSKYLAHILAKGFKQNPKPVENMLLELEKLLPQILTFCKNQQNETFFLKSIKPGLISKHLSITEITLDLFTMFTKNLTNKYQIIKVQLMSTLILSLRRHSCQLSPIIKSLTEMIGYNRNLLTLFQSHGSSNQINLLLIELINLAESEGQISQIFEIYKLDQYTGSCLIQIKNAELFANSASLILKLSQHNYEKLLGNSQYLNSLVQMFNNLNISKRGDVIISTNLIFAFLQLFGKRKISIAPQFFKLAVERYRQAINQDESHNYLINFLQIFQYFPSIPASAIAQAIVIRYEKGTTLIGQLQLDILLNSLGGGDQKLALRVYNIVTKLFVQEVGSVESISSIIETIIRRFDSKIIFDLTVKFAKVCLAVYYANLRKLNYSKSLIDGTIKLDVSNIFYKAKNSQIQKLLTTLILIRDQKINKALEPLVCYSFFQSQMKNKDEADGLKKIMLLLGDQEQLRKIYETDAKLMLEDVRNEGRKKSESKEKVQNSRYKQIQNKNRVSSDASLLLKKKELLYNSLAGQKVNSDAQKGLQKYNKVYLQRMAKLSQQQQKKVQEEEKKEQLRRKFTMKILQKGIKVSSKQVVINNLYQFNSKQKQLEKDLANDFSYLPFYDPQNEEERDVKAVQYVMKKYSKIFKVYYHNYGGKLRPNTIKLFEDISQRGNLMQSANVWKLLRDHQLDNFITVKEVQYIVQNINAHLKKQYKDSSVLDYEVFENFIIQCSLAMFSRPPKDMRSHPISQMIEQVINKLKQHAQQNRIDEKLFDDGQSIFSSSKTEEIADLNSKLQQNPDYILPEGYKKFTVKRMNFDHKFYLDALQESYKDVFEILDEIISENLGFNIIEPYSITITKATARPVLYQTETGPTMKQRSLSSIFPRQSKISKEGNEGQQQNLQKNDLEGSKIENKYLKEKKFKDEQRKMKQEEYEKKRQQRDKELKQMLQKYRQKQQQIEKQKQQKQRQQARKQEQEKKKREKYEQQVKKKVNQYMEKKKIDKIKEQQESKKKKQDQLKNYERLKQDVDKKKKMVEESKQKKLQQAQAIKQKQAEQKKKKQQQSRLRQLQKKEKTKKLLEQYRQRREKAEQQKLKMSVNQKDDLKKSPSKKKHLISSKQLPKNDNLQKKQIEVQQIGNQTNGGDK